MPSPMEGQLSEGADEPSRRPAAVTDEEVKEKVRDIVQEIYERETKKKPIALKKYVDDVKEQLKEAFQGRDFDHKARASPPI